MYEPGGEKKDTRPLSVKGSQLQVGHVGELSRTDSVEEHLQPIDPLAEKALLRKIDWHVLPILTFLFMLAFLDRVNIGNAKIQGMIKELDMKSHDYNIALFIFFIPYILFEVPANLFIRKVQPSTWLCGTMFLWGVCTVAEGCVKKFEQLVAIRFLVGLFEAGFVPGAVYLISMYYKRYELQWRLSIFFSASIIAGAFGGLIAYGLSHMNGVGGYAGWRWIFIIEGLITIVAAVIGKFLVVDWPEHEAFLSPSEQALLQRRLRDDTGFAQMDTLNRKSLKRIFLDWKIFCGVAMYIGCVTCTYSTSFFIPTILNEMGYTSVDSQLRTVPIYLAAALMSFIVAWSSDRAQRRFIFTLPGLVLACIGYILLLNQNHLSTNVKYMSCFFIVIGGYMTQPVLWVWLNNNMGGHYKRSVAIAMQIGFGNVGGIIASNIFITEQAPGYRDGYATSLAMSIMCGGVCILFYAGLKRENAKRERGERDYRFVDEVDELGNMGDDHPRFRFTL